MTTKEFSDAFDTLIASYNHKADFGDLASYADVTLDEYEKSVFLTQAQDNVIKNYFNRLANSLAEGFDDSIRRQADFSSLITVKPCTRSSSGTSTNWSTGSARLLQTYNSIKGAGSSYAGYELVIKVGATINHEYDYNSEVLGVIVPLGVILGSTSAYGKTMGSSIENVTLYGYKETDSGLVQSTDYLSINGFTELDINKKKQLISYCQSIGAKNVLVLSDSLNNPTADGLWLVGNSMIDTNVVGGILKSTITIESGGIPNEILPVISNFIMNGELTFQNLNSLEDNYLGIMSLGEPITTLGLFTISSFPIGNKEAYDERGIMFQLPPDMLLMLNERVKSTDGKFLVVVPISYKEYDRLMSRAYALPLKKQCWRLFEGEYADSNENHIINAEIIPKEGILVIAYIVRYIRRPNPIILTDLQLTMSLEPLEIDGHTAVTECELNPILHMDILEEAVRLALNSKGIETRDLKAAREAAKRS